MSGDEGEETGRRTGSSAALPAPMSPEELDLHRQELALELRRVEAESKATEFQRELQKHRNKLAGWLIVATIVVVVLAFAFLFFMLAIAPQADWIARALVLLATTIFFAGACTAAIQLTTTTEDRIRLKDLKPEPLMLPEKVVSQVLDIVKDGTEAAVKAAGDLIKKAKDP